MPRKKPDAPTAVPAPPPQMPEFPDGKLVVPEKLTDEFIEQYCANRWLGLGDVSKLHLKNPFDRRTQDDIENPHVFILDLMRKPENFGFTCQTLFDVQLAPLQIALLQEFWKRPFVLLLASRGGGKSWLAGVYIMLRLLFNQGSKIVVCGAAFRQSKIVFDYCVKLWEDSPIYREIAGDDRKNGPRRDVDRCSLRIGDSIAYAIPVGSGEKIRGLRSNITFIDEFASINRDVFETVIRGFGAVSNSPVEKHQKAMRKVALQEHKQWTPAHEMVESGDLSSNQTIIAGTASYHFNHFYDYWKRYKAIVESRGDPRELEKVFGGPVPKNFRWQDFCVIRIPWGLLPLEYMDEKQIQQARATITKAAFDMEFNAIFSVDSTGFFRRSVVENCVVGKTLGLPVFHATLHGRAGLKYVMAVDPASESDNFCVVLLEIHATHRRVVYCWTTTRAAYKARQQKGLSVEGDFFAFACRKIRQLCADFDVERIVLDKQGGGVAVLEGLGDTTRLQPGERPILPVIDDDKPMPSDLLAGEHIVEIAPFAKADWLAGANHGLKKDLEDKAVLFPEFDTALVALAFEEDMAAGRIVIENDEREKLYDTLEDVVLEIEDMKDELASIVHSTTAASGRERWDTPDHKMPGDKRGRLKKDRYSALLMANMCARTRLFAPAEIEYNSVGGFAQNLGGKSDGPMYAGPAWWTQAVNGMGESYGMSAKRP